MLASAAPLEIYDSRNYQVLIDRAACLCVRKHLR